MNDATLITIAQNRAVLDRLPFADTFDYLGVRLDGALGAGAWSSTGCSPTSAGATC